MKRVVLWHGWGMHPTAWDGFAAPLVTLLTSCEVSSPALPGYAGMAAPAPYTLDALIDTMLADLHSPVTLCGWSLGAMLAMRAALRHPDKVARLILIGATPSFVQRTDWPHGMPPQMLVEFAAAVDVDPQAALKRFIALFNQNDVNARTIGRALVRALAACALPPRSVLADGLALLRDTDLRALAPQISQPTLLLHGAHDSLMPLAAAEWLAAALPQARLAVLPDAAHAPFLSDAVRCATLMADFIHA